MHKNKGEAFPGVPLGRRMRALKMWFVIREQGVAGLMARIRRDLDQARWLEAQVRREPRWKILAPVRLQTLVLRHEPPGLAGEALDVHTRALADAINLSGEAYLTPAVIDGRWAIRVSLGGANTEQEHVEALWRLLRKQAAAAPVP